MKIIGHYFVRSDHLSVRIDSNDRRTYEKKGYVMGNICSDKVHVYMVKPCEAWIYVERGGKTYKQNMSLDICKYYGKQLLKLERFNLFVIGLMTGSIKLVWNEGKFEIEDP